MQSNPHQVKTVEALAGAPRNSFAVSVRHGILFLFAISIAYFFIWIPWRNSRANILFFYGFGLIQIAAVYTQDLNDDPRSVLAAPPLFLNPFMFHVADC